jgi:DNA-binding GntR family transcriptional regulator
MTTDPGLDDSSAYLAPPVGDGPDAWTAATADRHGTQQLLAVEEIDPPAAVAEALQLCNGQRVVVRRRLMFLDGHPVEIADSYYPAPLAAGTPLAENRKIKGGAPKAIAALGLVIAYADEAIVLDATATEDEAELLQTFTGTRVVRLFRIAYTGTDTPIEVTASVMLPAGRTLRHRLIVN